jgi:RNA polymerase sigma factor (TIGR02999 family)
MHSILVHAGRARAAEKRSGPQARFNLNESIDVIRRPDHSIVALDDALHALEALDQRKVRVIELRFFGGLSVEETAAVLNISPQSVMRDWKLARAWLQREMLR